MSARPGGISSFIDAFTVRKKDVEEYTELARLGLRRVFLGVESGDEELLRFLRKPATSDGVREIVDVLKRASLSVGVILLVGAGGDLFASGHVKKTIELVRALPLGFEDKANVAELVSLPLAAADLPVDQERALVVVEGGVEVALI